MAKSTVKSAKDFKTAGKSNYVFSGKGLPDQFKGFTDFTTEKNKAGKQVTRAGRTALDAFLANQTKKPTTPAPTKPVPKPTTPGKVPLKPTQNKPQPVKTNLPDRVVDSSWLADSDAAYAAAMGDARRYFENMGVDPNAYMKDITSAVDRKRATIVKGTKAPGSFYGNVGEEVFNFLQNAGRTRAQRGIADTLNERSISDLLNENSDDRFIEQYMEDALRDPRQQIENLKARGIYTDTGYSAAMEALLGQKDRARRQLTEIGDSVLETGRGDLRKIMQQGTSFADSLMLGQNFDAGYYGNQAKTKASSFLDSLGSRFKSFVPDDLFDTSGLTLAAGRAQGAQNTPYDLDAQTFFSKPGAGDEEDKKKKKKESFANSLSA